MRFAQAAREIITGKQTINPDGWFRSAWDINLFVLTLALGIIAPLELIYHLERFSVFGQIAILLSLIFAVDMFLNFRTSFYQNGILCTDKRLIRLHYLRGWFIVDFLSVIPSELITGPVKIEIDGASLDIAPFMRMVRVLRLLHLKELLNRFRNADSFNPSMVRLTILLFWLMLAAHWGACGWILLGNINPNYNDAENYLRALYWVITTFATIGYGDITPLNISQIAYTIVIELLGVGMFGYMIGNIASLLANMDIARAKYTEKLTRLNLYLDYHHVPGNLRQRIRRYYKYIWESRRGYDENQILADLPSGLQKDLAIFLHADVLEKVPLFKGASDGFIREIVMQLRPAMFTPGDFIFREGEVGHNMYFISKGSVEIISEKTGAVFATISEGGFFGEISLVMDMPRTASVRALDYSDMYTLDKHNFHEVLRDFPEFALKVREMAVERMKSRNLKAEKK